MTTLYLFQRLGVNPITGKVYEAETVSLTEKQAYNVSKKRVEDEKPYIKEEPEEPTLKRERSEGAPEPDMKPAPPKKAKVAPITTYGHDYKQAVLDLYILCFGPRPLKGNDGRWTWTDKEVDVHLWEDEILPMVNDIEDEKERRWAALYALNASMDLNVAYAAEWNEERQEVEMETDLYFEGVPIMRELGEDLAGSGDDETLDNIENSFREAVSSIRHLSDLHPPMSIEHWVEEPESDDE